MMPRLFCVFNKKTKQRMMVDESYSACRLFIASFPKELQDLFGLYRYDCNPQWQEVSK